MRSGHMSTPGGIDHDGLHKHMYYASAARVGARAQLDGVKPGDVRPSHQNAAVNSAPQRLSSYDARFVKLYWYGMLLVTMQRAVPTPEPEYTCV